MKEKLTLSLRFKLTLNAFRELCRDMFMGQGRE